MTGRIFGSTCVAAMLSVGMVAAQSSNQAPTSAPTPGNSQQGPSSRTTTPQARTQADQQVTLTGCVMRENGSDYVLANAMPTGTSGNVSGGVTGSTSTATGTTGSSSSSATATTGAAGLKYRLSGERDLSTYVGQRVEIVGRMDANTASGATGNGSTTSPGLGTPGLGTTGSTTTGSSTSGIGTRSGSGVGTPSGSGIGTPGTTSGAGNSATGVGSAGSTSSTGSSTSSTGTTGAGAATTAPGTTSGSTSSTGTIAPSAVGQSAAMQHVTITSVRATGGSCQ